MRVIFLIITAVLLTGCMQAMQRNVKPWTKEGGTQAQFAEDKMRCQQYGMQSAMAHGLSNNGFVEVWIYNQTKDCLQSLGYHQ